MMSSCWSGLPYAWLMVEPHKVERGRLRIVSLTKYIPYPAIPHAGGKYLLTHAKALRRFAELELLAPVNSVNRAALRSSDGRASLLRGRGPGGRGGWKFFWDVESAWAGSAVPRPWRLLFASTHAPWGLLKSADVIEFQWSEMMALAPFVRRRLPRSVLVGIAHDVITQRWERASEASSNWLQAALFGLAARRSRRTEAKSFAALDLLIVFSDKDARLAQEICPSVRIEVVHPGFEVSLDGTDAEALGDAVVLFTGALGRRDNAEAIEWFIEHVWPRIVEESDGVRLVVAGANPSPELQRHGRLDSSITVTGFVESLSPYYRGASVFIAPLKTGAGVKFKTIEALLHGLPVVASPVGAEGVDAPDSFLIVRTEASEFAEAVLAEIGGRGKVARSEISEWANGIYGVEAFESRLKDLYTSVATKRPQSK